MKAFKKVQDNKGFVTKQDFAQVLYYIGKMNDKKI